VELVSYAHSIDFGAKGYGNLVELAWLQRFVADELGRPAGRLLMVVKSAHVYQTESGYVRGVLISNVSNIRHGAINRSARQRASDAARQP
jgi:thymidylate synthase